MGQQQLLLLVIGVVLVAIAVMAAFPILDRYYRQDEADGLLERGLAIATHAAGWHSVNSQFGGANGSYERLATEGLSVLSLDDTTIRGVYAVTDATTSTLEITGVSIRYPEVGIRVFVDGYTVTGSETDFQGGITLEAPTP